VGAARDPRQGFFRCKALKQTMGLEVQVVSFRKLRTGRPGSPEQFPLAMGRTSADPPADRCESSYAPPRRIPDLEASFRESTRRCPNHRWSCVVEHRGREHEDYRRRLGDLLLPHLGRATELVSGEINDRPELA